MFDSDLFISYASLDNLPVRNGQQGWVENFQKALEVRLYQLLGEKPRIWRKPKLNGSDAIALKPAEPASKIALMLPILSPRYIKSEWCMNELRDFLEKSNGDAAGKIDRKSRIFKLVKAAVPYDEHPPVISDNLSYEFYIVDPVTGKENELNQDSRGELDQIYWARLDDIAHDICDVLEKISRIDEKDSPPPQKKEKVKIFLAETCPGLREQRDIIRRDLSESGYLILPTHRLSSDAAEFEESVDRLLDQCVLSIHLVGGSYGPAPAGSQKSIVELQNATAVEKSKTGNLSRLIWLPPGSGEDIADERQQRFVRRIRRDVETQYGADVLETPLDDLKYAVYDKLASMETALKPLSGTGKKNCEKEKEKQAPVSKPENSHGDPPVSANRNNSSNNSNIEAGTGPQPMKVDEGISSRLKNLREKTSFSSMSSIEGIRLETPPQIYLICDKRDLDHIRLLEDFLYGSEFDVILPAFQGEEADLINDHRENLKCCDAAVIYYGAGNDLWLRSIARDFRKIAGYGRTRPLPGKAIYLAPPAVKAKEHLRYHGWHIIDGMKGFSPELITPFMEILKITRER